jgi:hypothetical protein
LNACSRDSGVECSALLEFAARDSSNTERRTADATVARQDHHGAEQGLALPIRVGNNGKQREEKKSF